MIKSSAFKIKRYEFSADGLENIQDNHYARNLWPVVYVLNGGKKKQAYIGESTNIVSRVSTHLANTQKNQLSSLELISSDKFNKSAALDIEANLIRYIAADGEFELLNSNLGIANHNYYQKHELYRGIFEEIWDELRAKGIAKHSLLHLNNSDVFKYSPYKSLTLEQEQGLHNILKCLLDNDSNRVVVEGGAGTGKTILAIYLFKLLLSDDSIYLEELEDTNTSILQSLVDKFKAQYPNPKIALVVPMSSFRSTLKKAFRGVKGLSAKMVISPSEATKDDFDLLVVDESHRLRRRVNLGAYYGAFDKACELLGLDKSNSSELDWMLMKSKKTVFFYDVQQSIKPSDVLSEDVERLKNDPHTIVTKLKSQFRSQGGNKYSDFINALFDGSLKSNSVFNHKDYEMVLYESLPELVADVKARDSQYGLSRLVAGYAWPWKSRKDPDAFDIEIEEVSLRWNTTASDWINSEGAVDEVGCIHTTQGYDLNYTGIIFGPEISFDPDTNEIVIIEENYFDKNGKQSIKDPNELKSFIVNIYKTILLRAIRGTYIYVCDPKLREYLSQYIAVKLPEKTAQQPKLELMPVSEVEPFVNAIPLYDLQAAAGGFSDQQDIESVDWIALPNHIKPTTELFACYVVGESMNKVIPNGSLCLFKKNPGGSRNGKIVLVQHHDIEDSDHGGTYTVKTYYSEKTAVQGELLNKRIVLKPETTAEGYEPIIIESGEGLNVVGEFLAIVSG